MLFIESSIKDNCLYVDLSNNMMEIFSAEGFTENVNVTASLPLIRGPYSPKSPLEMFINKPRSLVSCVIIG